MKELIVTTKGKNAQLCYVRITQIAYSRVHFRPATKQQQKKKLFRKIKQSLTPGYIFLNPDGHLKFTWIWIALLLIEAYESTDKQSHRDKFTPCYCAFPHDMVRGKCNLFGTTTKASG